jgi:hypothetical protein
MKPGSRTFVVFTSSVPTVRKVHDLSYRGNCACTSVTPVVQLYR